MHRLGAKDVRVLPGIALDSEEMQRLNALPTRNGDSTFRLVSVGWLLGWKGFHLGLQAFARLRDKLPNSEYWIIGEGPQQNQLKSLAESLGVQDRVRFLGRLPREEVFARLAECDVLVHPSLHDSGGWVCLEAMAAGRPVLCLDIAGPREIVTEETGFKVRAYTPEEAIAQLSEKMYTLAVNPDLRLRMAQASRQRIAEHFSWDAKCKQYALVYEEVVHQLQPQAQ
jgi:glycosyltransferase involved in cell wall biosynthesis